ncbi:hypothetical protein RDABS01_040460 [Bienertia sinuspersici]
MDSSVAIQPHIAVCPSAGIGHLTPFLRLASMLSPPPSTDNSCNITLTLTLIIIRPTLSSAEENQINTFLSTHPHINSSHFHILPVDNNSSKKQDPFVVHYDAVFRSSYLLANHLSTLSPQPSVVFSDLMLASGITKPLADLGIPNYTLISTSASFFTLMVTSASLRTTSGDSDSDSDGDEIPGLGPIPMDDIPPFLMSEPDNNMLTRIIDTNCRHLHETKGVLLNSFDFFEPESVSTLQSGKLLATLPPIFPIGPFISVGSLKGSNNISWLDNQPPKSVVFISFGSRTAMAKDQIRELGKGIERSGISFLWVIKTTVVDKEDKEELNDLLGEAFFMNTKERGLIVKEWVNQEVILAHSAIGGFLSHCGWNSVMEAAQRGVPLLAWPLHGDQRVNARVVEKAGLGVWERSWGWIGERLVKSEEIALKIQEMMTSEKLKKSAARVGEEATKAWEIDGSSKKMFGKIIDNICQK